jgi:hypothetical protein
LRRKKSLKTGVLLLFTGVVLFFLGCRKDQNDLYAYSLDKQGSKVFVLDDVTPPLTLSVSYYESKDCSFYLHLNMYRSKYYVYNYKTGVPVTNFGLEKFPNPYGWYFINFDSVFICYRGLKNIIILADSAGIEMYNRNTESDLYDYNKPAVLCKTTNPILVRNDTLFYTRVFIGVDPRETKRSEISLGGAYNLKTGERTNFVGFPHTTFQKNYGYTDYWYNYTCFNDTELIVSFPASEYLYRYSLKTLALDSVKCYSDYFSSIKPMSDTFEDKDFIEETVARYYASSPSYNAVFYDKYRQVYYRVAELPNRKKDFDTNKPMESVRKRQTIIIMNKDFRKIGETYIGGNYRIMCTLVTPDGLLLNPRDPDESKMTYDIYKLVQNEK